MVSEKGVRTTLLRFSGVVGRMDFALQRYGKDTKKNTVIYGGNTCTRRSTRK